MSKNHQRIIGLTGGIGSGKTTVARLFQELGIDVIDADQIARDIVSRDSTVLQKISDQFGSEILHTDGRLDRAKLRHHIFEVPEDRAWLEALLHPIIREKILEQIKQSQSDYMIVVVPLLVESIEDYRFVDRILVVDAPEEKQLERIIARDHISLEEARKMIAAQVDRMSRLLHADDIIDNSKDDSNLEAQIQALHEQYLVL